jgi:predicted nucleotidyltransferase component of viral defense system
MSRYPHHDKDTFVVAVRTTANQEGFGENLVEKDYYCSLILKEIYSKDDHGLIFKGGTLLNKVHAGFYRLSEDLDFSIDADPKLKREARRKMAELAKASIARAVKNLSLKFSKNIIGRNESSQYNCEIEYDSMLTGTLGTIKVDIGIKERVLEKESLKAKTLVRDPFHGDLLIPDFEIQGLSLLECYSEKLRAAMARKEPAIRDIFDVDYALKKKLFDAHEIAPLVRHKFETQNRQILLNDERKHIFKQQLGTDLKPVLRDRDFDGFDFESAWTSLLSLKKEIFK